ncbi:18255_t:CDS:2 [Dentiscutata erythropus]|uniref:18255_t:CDS:1 n=1 Tax=Dentiscutata erythropus TaxID=1348616 RepID=A0A9N9EPN8_9GLOM|nr:18255_t:CDS:2 [Dentiscutata erythropus]
MSEITLLCYLQGAEKPFNVVVNETDTIEDLKQLISYRMRKVISEKNIITSGFKIWKVYIPVDEADILRKVPSELKSGKPLEDDQNVTSIGKVLNNYIQIFMGNPDSVFIPPDLEKVVQNMGERIQELENKIQDLINETRSDEFWLDKDYIYTKAQKKKHVKVGCRVVEIGNTGRLKVILGEDYSRERKTVSSLLALEKWLLDCAGLSILYRNKDDTHLRNYLEVKRDEEKKSFKKIYEGYKNYH